MFGMKFSLPGNDDDRTCFHISSINEEKVEKIIQDTKDFNKIR